MLRSWVQGSWGCSLAAAEVQWSAQVSQRRTSGSRRPPCLPRRRTATVDQCVKENAADDGCCGCGERPPGPACCPSDEPGQQGEWHKSEPKPPIRTAMLFGAHGVRVSGGTHGPGRISSMNSAHARRCQQPSAFPYVERRSSASDRRLPPRLTAALPHETRIRHDAEAQHCGNHGQQRNAPFNQVPRRQRRREGQECNSPALTTGPRPSRRGVAALRSHGFRVVRGVRYPGGQ